MESRDDLLQPSFTEDRTAATAIYSAAAGYLAAFFGGPVAALSFAAVNSRRLGRLRADAPLLLGGLALFVGALGWGLMGWYPPPIQRWFYENLQLPIRGAGLIYFGAIYLLHRRHYRAMAMLAIQPPSAWGVGLACCALGVLTTVVAGVLNKS